MARKIGITRDDVLRAAIGLAAGGGPDAVTLSAVAAKLGIQTPSLYAHVDGLAGLRRALALEAASALAEAMAGATAPKHGIDAIRAAAYAYRQFAHTHPGLYRCAQLGADPGKDPELGTALYAVIKPVLAALGEAGITGPDEQVHLTRAFRSALHGFVSLEQHAGFGLPAAVDESFRRLVELLIAGLEHPASVEPSPVHA